MIELRVLSPLAKVFPTHAPQPCTPRFSGLRNEVISFQLAFRAATPEVNAARAHLRMEIDSPVPLRARRVKFVPVRVPAFPGVDDNYLNGAQPGLYPDPLIEIPPHGLRVACNCWETLWFDFEPNGTVPAGDYSAEIRLYGEESGELWGTAKIALHLIDAELPKQTLIHTKWFYCDCLASYYNVEMFSEAHWEIIERFVRCAVNHGINTILTPTHTPPLDTRIGTYRPTTQLVSIRRENGHYTFGFEKLRRWVEMCERCGVEYYEIAHFFSQWGARYAPQIVAETENGTERIFGWDTNATGPEYAAFLAEYLPALDRELKALGVADRALYHISDEPSKEHLEGYLAAKEIAHRYLPDGKFIDALSDVSFYDSGAVEHPVPATNHIEPFLERNIPGLWAYYCIGQGTDVSNLFHAMPGARTRVLGAQLYKFNIEGFLQWGFNFYYSQFSDYLIDPWLDTDCDGFGSAGDAYQVYPGRDGQPVESIRLMQVDQALQDLRAMQLLERLSDRETVLRLIDDDFEPIRFASYPHDEAWILGLRTRVNREIEKRL